MVRMMFVWVEGAGFFPFFSFLNVFCYRAAFISLETEELDPVTEVRKEQEEQKLMRGWELPACIHLEGSRLYLH